MEVLSTRALNRALLARQLLLERSTLSLPEALEQVAGLQTQYAPSAYIGLWSRLHAFDREVLTRALVERGAIQGTLLRATIHVVSTADYWTYADAIRTYRLEWWTRVSRARMAGIDVAAAVDVVRSLLADGPRRQSELVSALTDRGFPRVAWSGMNVWLDLVRVPPSGTWDRRRADVFALAEQWSPRPATTNDDPLEQLVRRYLAGFGPASLADLASWAGIPITALRPVVERVGTRRFVDDGGGTLYDLPDAPLPDPQTPAPVRFLSTWDANLLIHVRRTQLLPERFRDRIFSTRAPQSVPTFLVDGAVAGTWKYEAGRVSVQPFEPLPKRVHAELDDEAQRLAAYHR